MLRGLRNVEMVEGVENGHAQKWLTKKELR